MATQSTCPKCGGSGWIIIERANVSGAEPCDCRLVGRAERIEERADIPPLYRHSSFENFDTVVEGNPVATSDLKRVRIMVERYARDFLPGKTPPGLLLVGDPGVGKTHLAVAAFRKIIQEKSLQGVFFNYQHLLDRIRMGYDQSSNSSDKAAYREALDAEILLLDDVGAHRVTSWVEDTINSIVTHRCDNRKALIATTNLPDPDAGSVITRKTALGAPEYRETLAERIGMRARSRLFEMCTVIRMPLIEDYRLRKARTF